MLRLRHRELSASNPWTDRAPVKPFDPIAHKKAAARAAKVKGDRTFANRRGRSSRRNLRQASPAGEALPLKEASSAAGFLRIGKAVFASSAIKAL